MALVVCSKHEFERFLLRIDCAKKRTRDFLGILEFNRPKFVFGEVFDSNDIKQPKYGLKTQPESVDNKATLIVENWIKAVKR